MKEYLKKVKLTSLILAVASIVFGICLLIWPKTSELVALYVISVALMLMGIASVIEFFLYGYESFGFVSGAIYILFGIVISISARAITQGAVFGFIVGLALLIMSLMDISNSWEYRRLGAKNWWLATLLSVIELILGIVILVNPFIGESAFFIFLGAVFIYEGVATIIKVCAVSSKVRKLRHKIKDIFKIENAGVVLDEKDFEAK